MRSTIFLALFLAASLQTFSQTATTAPEGQPNDPRAILAAAAPYYDFFDPALKPWHLKATYQLYDDKGKPAEQGTFEYWWASPKVYRSTWTRPGATYTDWHTADGKHAYQATGERLKFFEYKLQAALLSPLPDSSDLNPDKIRLDSETVSAGGAKFPCIMVVPLMPQQGQLQMVSLGMFPTYCFDPQLPILRFSYSFGTVTTQFNSNVNVQGRFMAHEIALFEDKRMILTATVDAIEGLLPSDVALTPPPDIQVVSVDKVNLAPGVAGGPHLVKKQIPIYPKDAKDAQISGTVLLDATIGIDGGIHELRVISAP